MTSPLFSPFSALTKKKEEEGRNSVDAKVVDHGLKAFFPSFLFCAGEKKKKKWNPQGNISLSLMTLLAKRSRIYSSFRPLPS